MSLERDLDTFWKSYLPVLEIVENASEETDQGRLQDKSKKLFSELEMPDGWSIETVKRDKWYDGLLVSEVRIPYADSKAHLELKPKYRESEDGKIVWDSAARQTARERELGIRKSISYYADIFVNFKPQVKPDWQRDKSHHLPDYRRTKSAVGVMTAEIESGSASFYSFKRAEFVKAEQEKPDWVIGERGLELRKIPIMRLIAIRLNYRQLEEGMSDEEMTRAMGEMYEGYTYITSMAFRVEDLGSGEIDRFLQHIGIE